MEEFLSTTSTIRIENGGTSEGMTYVHDEEMISISARANLYTSNTIEHPTSFKSLGTSHSVCNSRIVSLSPRVCPDQ